MHFFPTELTFFYFFNWTILSMKPDHQPCRVITSLFYSRHPPSLPISRIKGMFHGLRPLPTLKECLKDLGAQSVGSEEDTNESVGPLSPFLFWGILNRCHKYWGSKTSIGFLAELLRASESSTDSKKNRGQRKNRSVIYQKILQVPPELHLVQLCPSCNDSSYKKGQL